MAVNHSSGDNSKDFSCSLSGPNFSTSSGSIQEELEDQNLWPRSLARKWIVTLFMGTCLLFCARMIMPVCAVSMAATFNWSKIDSGLVLGAFFWGYCFTQILGGHASDKVGGERVLAISAASWALITAGTPLLTHLGSHTLAVMTVARFLMGLLQGVFFPSLASLCSQRVVEGERGFLMSTMHSGSHLGTLLAGGMGSLMLDRYGWESMFYSTGFLAGLWALIVWQCFLKGDVTSKQMETRKKSQWSLSRTHWLSLFKKPPVWAMVITHMCMCSTSYTILSWSPTYFKESFPHASEGVYNIIPWLIAIPSALGGGYVSDFLINQGALYGFMNMMGALMGLVLVSVSGYLIEVTLSWATVFSVITLVNVTGLGIFIVFGDARRVDLEVYSQETVL